MRKQNNCLVVKEEIMADNYAKAYREIYESTCSDEELKSIAEKKLSEFKEKQAKKKYEILFIISK